MFVQKTNPGIRITILLEDEDTLVFSPSFSKIQTELLRMIDSIANAVKLFPRIEAKVSLDVVSTNIFLKVNNVVIVTFLNTDFNLFSQQYRPIMLRNVVIVFIKCSRNNVSVQN